MFFKFNVLVESKRLTVFRIGQNRLDRLELMKRLSEQGYSNKQISKYLNDRNIKTVRANKKYTPKDVWVGLKKYRKRLERFKLDNIIGLLIV